MIVLLFMACCLSFESQAQSTAGQGVASINVTGIPAVIEAPFTNQFEQNFRNGRYQLIFTFNSSSFEPADFRFRFRVTRQGKEVLEVISDPKTFQPGAYVFTSVFDELPFSMTFEEAMDKVNGKLRKQLIQEGTVPEGNYILNVEAIPEDRSAAIASSRSVTPFTVRYPQPPMLINPSNNSNLTLEVPVFNWTPVVGVQGYPMQYDFLLVEVLPNQTPLQAINSNRAHAERSLVDQNTLAYTPEFLPLEEGKQYAWRVTVGSVGRPLPIKHEGQSEIHTFVYKKGASEETIAGVRNLQNIPLIPDFASLINLGGLEVEKQGKMLVLNGTTDLELKFNSNYTLPVEVRNLSLLDNNLKNPTLVGGEVVASQISKAIPALKHADNLVSLDKLSWELGTGLQVSGKVILPNGKKIASSDWLRLTSQGLHGQLTAVDENGLLTLGSDPVEASLTQIEASFPDMQLFAKGKLSLFGSEVFCSVDQFNLLDDSTVPVYSCGTDDMDIPLVENSEQLRLSLNGLSGGLDYDFATDDFSYDLTTEARLITGLDRGNACSTSIQLGLSDINGVNASQLTSNCSIYADALDLGFMKLKPQNVSLNTLTYLQRGNWNFDLGLKGTLVIPALNNWVLPQTRVSINSDGLEFPDLDWNAQQLGISDPLEIERFKIKPLRFVMPSFTFPWFEWNRDNIASDDTGEWNFTMDFDLEFNRDDHDSILPECIRARTSKVQNAGFNSGIFKADIPATVLRNCKVDLAQGYTLTIHELGGELSATASAQELELDTNLLIDAGLEAGSPFMCGSNGSLPVTTATLSMDDRGILQGSIDNIVTGCPITLGPFTAVADRSSLLFSENAKGDQQIVIDTNATLNLNSSQTVSGTFVYDVLNGEIMEMDFDTDRPFVLNLPSKSNPKLSFLVEQMQLTKNGIMIDGRHRLLLADPGELRRFASSMEQQLNRSAAQKKEVEISIPEEIATIDVTFDQVLFSLQDLSIQSGKIIFDESFAFQAAVSPQGAGMDFSVKEPGNYKLQPNSLYTELGGQVIIDSSGLHTKGEAKAGLQVGELNMDSLKVEFSRDFTMGFKPFGVHQGQADLYYQSRRLAYFDNTGFHPDPTYLTRAIPDTLDLPTRDAAYIVLRDQQGDLLVDAQRQQDGTFTMSTLAPLDLVIPALKGNRAFPPTTKVSFTNIVYDPGSQDVTVGTIEGDFNPDIDLTDMGVPFKLKKVRYDDGFVAQTNSSQRGLFLEGDIVLYHHDMGDNGEAVLYLQNGNRLLGDIDLKNLDSDIPLVPQSQRAVLNVDSLSGTVNIPLDDLEIPDVSLDMGGQFRLLKQNQSTLASLSVRATYQNENFMINAIQQPSQASDANIVILSEHIGFRIDQINTLSLSYRSQQNDFNFRSELDFSLLMDLADGDSMEVPLKAVEITEAGFSIPQQVLNDSSNPPLITPSFELGAAELSILEFRTLQPISFNWFTGEGIPPAFEMDLDMKLSALADNAPQASQASITLNNVGFNQGVITGQVVPYTFPGDGAPIALGGSTNFMLTSVGGGLTNEGTTQSPVQGYDIDLTGSLDYPVYFTDEGTGCNEPEMTVNLSRAGGLVGTVNNITPCGELVYGPAKLEFDPASTIEFAFSNETQSLILDGSVTAEIEQENAPDILANGTVNVDVVTGTLKSGSILVNDLFTYGYPQNDPMFMFRVQQARLDQNGVVFTGDAGLTFPNSPDTARVTFTNFTIHPQNEGITDGSLTIQDSLAFEVGVSPIEWELVDPSSTFDRDNAARMLTMAGITMDTNGMTLNGSATASARAAGQSFPDLDLNYNGLSLDFSPTRVTAGRADFTVSGNQSPFGHLDKDGFDLNIPGLITSVIPDTLPLPNKNTAFLVLGDESGNRYEMVEGQGARTLRTLQGQTVDLVIPGFTDSNNDTLKAQVEFDVTVDQFFNVQGGSVSLQNDVDLEPYTQLPVTIIELGYDSNTRELTAGTEVTLPQSLNNVDMYSSLVIDETGFKQGSLSVGEYRTTYLPSQENITPIAGDTLGQDALYFYVRGLEMEFGQNRSIAFSGQLKSSILKDSQDNLSPLHYAASYTQGAWDFNMDASHLTQNGIDLGYAKIDPIQDPQGQYQELFDVILNDSEFGIRFAGIVTMPDVAGDDLAVTVEQMKVSSQSPYFTVAAQTGLPDQEFTLFGDVMTLSTTNTAVSINNSMLGIELDGSFDFYTEQDVGFQDLVFRSDGTVDIQGGLSANLLSQDIEVLGDQTLVLKELNLALQNNKLELSASGSARLPDPLTAESNITISADTDGNVDVTGPEFIFDDGFSIDGGPTEYAIGSFATLELTGLALDVNLKTPENTSLYAAGVIFVENNVDKRIMFGDAGNLQQNPGIKYTPNQAVEWNVHSNFDPSTSPLKFEYEFFNVNIASIQVQNDVDVGDGEIVPFQAEIGGKTGLSIAGVSGEVGFSGFKFSTKGVDDIGKLDGGGTFTLMDIVSLELGEFDYQSAPDGQTVKLKFAEGQTNKDDFDAGPSVDSTEVDVRKYLHFKPGVGGQALNISLSEGISGGIDEVLYYEGADGELYLRIKNASLSLSDQAQLAVGMEFITAGGNGSGFSLMVAGGGKFASTGIAAAGKISTLNDQLSFGIFVAAKTSVNIMGVVEASALGGGFFFRPQMNDLTMAIDGVKDMDSQFQLNGPQPDVQNLKLAMLLYAGISVGGVGDNAAISANALIQVTDQFTKIDANGVVFNQQDKLEVGMYLTLLYTEEIAGIEGGIDVLVDYSPVMNGTSDVDFFATKDLTQSDSDVLWGITGNMDLDVLAVLDLNGNLIVSADGMLLEMGLAGGFDLAIISGGANFDLLAWYLPTHSDPWGIYSKLGVEFSILAGLAEFGGSVEGGLFDRGSYKMLYFAGEAYVSVIGVIDGNVRGWVKIQSKSPTLDYGRGSNAEMEQMIADAKAKANETKNKAEETKNNLEDAKDELDASIASARYARSNSELRKAGYKLLTSDDYTLTGLAADVLDAERDLHGNNNVPDIIKWLEDNVMSGNKRYYGTPAGYTNTREKPTIKDYRFRRENVESAITSVQQEAPPVQNRIDDAVIELSGLSDQMKSALESDGVLTIQNPVTNVQNALTSSNVELLIAPSFQVDSAVVDSNKSKLEQFESELLAADQRYREAIEAAAANIELVDLIVAGESSINWGSDTGVQLQGASGVSVNDVAYTYVKAVQNIREYNAELIGSYWDIHDWADVRYDLITQNASSLRNFARQTNWTSNPQDVVLASRVAAAREYALTTYEGESSPAADSSSIGQDVRRNNSGSVAIFQQSGEDFWYNMPRLGLDELRDESREIADSLAQVFDQKVNQISSAHKTFTVSVDQLYGIKAEMLTTVYGMIEEYNAWRQEAFSEQGFITEAPFTAKVQEIEQALAPPTIDYVSAVPKDGESGINYSGGSEYHYFYGLAGLSYQASHPLGVPEISFSLTEGTTSSIYSINDYYTGGVWDTYTSGGSSRWFNFHFPKENVNQASRDLTGAIRARSIGGTTISRFVNFSIPVSMGGTGTSNTVNFGDDTTPPSTPVVSHSYGTHDNKYWTPDSSRLIFTVKSMDNESDIALYQYKIGTIKGGDDIRGWTDLQGTRGTGLGMTEGTASVNGTTFYTNVLSTMSKMEGTIRGLSMQSNTGYYLSFRAVNGDGVESTVKEVSNPFVYDGTPPEDVTVSVTPGLNSLQRQQANPQPVICTGVTAAPAWSSQFVNEDYGVASGQEFTISWNSTDPESNIEGFLVTDANEPGLPMSETLISEAHDFTPVGQGTELTYTPSFDSDKYLYFQARNHVGMKSGTEIVGPIRSIDVTPPTTPDARVMGAYDGFKVYVTQLADDSQSGIKGYQYTIMDSSGTNVLRPWPDSTTVDFTLSSGYTGSSKPGGKFIRAQYLPQSGYYQVGIRAINKQNMPSRAVINEDVLFDSTPPEQPLATVTYVGQKEFEIKFDHLRDPESGIDKVEYILFSGDYLPNQTLNLEGTELENMSEILSEGTLNNPGTGKPIVISVSDGYFQKHPYPYKSGDTSNNITLQAAVIAVNGTGQHTINTIPIVIPFSQRQDYLNYLEQVQQSMPGEGQQDIIISLPMGN